MEKLRIEIGDKPMVVEPEMMIEVNEKNPLTSNEPMFVGSQFNRDFEYIGYPTNYKPLGENEGRVGYYQTVMGGEEKRHKPVFEVGTYENGTFIPQSR